jgi:hypothetical protein
MGMTQEFHVMSMNVSDFLLHRLGLWCVRRIYGFPGDGINGLMGALDRVGDAFNLVRAACSASPANAKPAAIPSRKNVGETS